MAGSVADVQYCIYADMVGGSEKSEIMLTVIHGWTHTISVNPLILQQKRES